MRTNEDDLLPLGLLRSCSIGEEVLSMMLDDCGQ